jgi:DNA recombination protein RmuC
MDLSTLLIIISCLLNIAILTFCLIIWRKKNTSYEGGDNEMIFRLLTNHGENLQHQNTVIASKFGDVQLGLAQLFNEQFETVKEKQTYQLKQLLELNKQELDLTRNQIQTQLSQSLGILNETNKNNFDLLNKTNAERLDTIQLSVEKKLDENLRKNLESFGIVQEKLVEMRGSAEKMIKSTESIDKLNTIFSRSSAGGYGDFSEKYLESFFTDNLSDKNWEKQYTIPGTVERIDYVLMFGDHKIGIDSKFPLDVFRNWLEKTGAEKLIASRDLNSAIKKMAEDISSKYEKTKHFDYVMMYVPTDSLYSYIVSNETLVSYLHKRKITPTSPNTILPLVILVQDYNFKLFMNSNAEYILNGLKQVSKNVQSFQEEFRKLGDKLKQAQGNYDIAQRSLDTVTTKVSSLEVNEKKELEALPLE